MSCVKQRTLDIFPFHCRAQDAGPAERACSERACPGPLRGRSQLLEPEGADALRFFECFWQGPRREHGICIRL